MGETDTEWAKSDIAAAPVRATRIGVLCYPGAQLSAIHGLADLFDTASRLGAERDASLPRIGTVMLEPEQCRNAPAAGLAALILPPSLNSTPSFGPDAALPAWMRQRHREGLRLCSVCAGAFLLAETGLLEQRRATTHWALAEAFAARFPRVRLDCGKLLIDDGDLVTAGGVMAWIDLGLRLIESILGPAIMLATARMFLVDPAGREQSYYANPSPRTEHGDAAVLQAQQWMSARLERPMSIAALAARSGLGERTFLRRFTAATGHKPSAYLQQLRVTRAKERLELSAEPLERIAWEVGYEDYGAFRKVFQRLTGINPGEYRQRFGLRQRKES